MVVDTDHGRVCVRPFNLPGGNRYYGFLKWIPSKHDDPADFPDTANGEDEGSQRYLSRISISQRTYCQYYC